jgi:hypothetical protein
LLEYIVLHPDLAGLRRWILVTEDAHGLYRKYGFVALVHPDKFMEIHVLMYSGAESHSRRGAVRKEHAACSRVIAVEIAFSLIYSSFETTLPIRVYPALSAPLRRLYTKLTRDLSLPT